MQITSSRFLKISFLFLLINNAYSVTCISLSNGTWTNAANWSCGVVPGCGDSIVISAGTTVSVTTSQNYTGCSSPLQITIQGSLLFINSSKIELPCNSHIYISAGGSIDAPGGGGGNQLKICGTTEWSGGGPPLTGPGCFPLSDPKCSTFLPIELINFYAQSEGEAVKTWWATATEINNDYFTIERTADVVNFEVVGTVGGAGNSSQTMYYTFTDAQPLHGISYYRLKQTDFNGQFKYFNWVAVSYDAIKDKDIVIFPNPNSGAFVIKGAEENSDVTVTDVLGQVILKTKIISDKTEINLSDFYKGIYFISINSYSKSVVKKIIIN